MSVTIHTNDQNVKDLLGRDYDPCRSLTVFVRTAAVMVAKMQQCVTAKGLPPYDAETLELIERWLAAGYYTKSDRLYTSRSHGGASGSFAGVENVYTMQAWDLDDSNCLMNIMENRQAGLLWLGKVPSDFTDPEVE